MLGQNITRLMKENGYTQRQLAMRAGCSECAISRYVNYEREPSIRILKNLAIALGVTVDELISERCCKDCIHYEDCKEYVSPYETFPETDGCERFQSTADVVPKSEVDRLQAEVKVLTENSITSKYPCCVSCSKGLILTKSLEEYDKLLADIANEVAREIFEEIERKSCVISETNHSTGYTRVVCYQISAERIAELKKKYTCDQT